MRTICCLLCNVEVSLSTTSGLPPLEYISHLRQDHAVLTSVDWLVSRTLSLQHSKLQDTLPPSVSITPVYKRKSSEVMKADTVPLKMAREAGSGEGLTLYKETMITPLECAPAWSLGCLYQCQICRVNFQTVTSFRSHLFFHSLSLAEYTEQHGEPEVKVTEHECGVCGAPVQCDPLHLSHHLATHSLTLPAYTDLHRPSRPEEDQENSEIVSTISSTSKSSPCLLETVRKSMDEEEEEDSEEEMMEMPEPQVEIEEPDSELVSMETEDLVDQVDQGELVENMFRHRSIPWFIHPANLICIFPLILIELFL